MIPNTEYLPEMLRKSKQTGQIPAKGEARQGRPNTNSGFTLIELLITIFLVSVGLVGVLAFFGSSLTSQFDAKNEVIAAGLAQEGTELARNIVDYNYLDSISPWYKEIANNKNGNSNCDWLDINSLADHKCETGVSLKKISVCTDSGNNRYYQCPSVDSANRISTDFSRKMEIKGENVNGISELPNGIDLDAGDCLNVVATVTWSGRTTKSTDIICKPRQ